MRKRRVENARLIALLNILDTDWEKRKSTLDLPISTERELSRFSTNDEIALFHRLFRGCTEAYPVRWESKIGKWSYAPVFAHEWQIDLCEKPRISGPIATTGY